MAREVYLDPVDFQKQLDEIESAAESFAALTYALQAENNKLDCVDKLVEAAEIFQKAMKSYTELQRMDLEQYSAIRSAWMNMDANSGSKTLFEHIKSAIGMDTPSGGGFR